MDINRQTVSSVLEQYLSGSMTKEEISDWAYDVLATQGDNSDELVNEILYNLVSYHDVGLIFDQYRPNRDKLEAYFTALHDDHLDYQKSQ